LYDHFVFFFVNGVISISNYLKNVVIKYTPQKPILIIPPVCNYKLFEKIPCEKKEDYFVYCASSAYLDVAQFVIDAFLQANIGSKYKLKLIISGNTNILKKINDERIILISNLDYIDLISTYKKAKALIIPLRNTIQDIARFPHKFSEYAASKSVIISSKIGDISFYFKDNETALLCDNYCIYEYAKKIEYVVSNSENIKKIELNAFNLGKTVFDECLYGQKIINFL
jgi:glycosyltransferase involved in cell wall biosynthesis